MKKINVFRLFLAVLTVTLMFASCQPKPYQGTLKAGDILFQDLPCSQSEAIKLATHSPYSHVGMILFKNGNPWVFEAVGPVKYTPLKEWIQQGDGGHFVAKRLKNADKVLTPGALSKMEALAQQFKGKAYDWVFDWSDDQMYCSELVWKMYQRSTGLEIGALQKFKELDFSNPEVKALLKERYGSNIPWNEPVISPGQMFNSSLLVKVLSE
jgi:hypothetical protein